MSDILNFTHAAQTHIQGMLAKEQGLGLRLSIKKAGCSGLRYATSIISKLIEGDIHLQVNPQLNVYLDPQCLEYIEQGLIVDYIEEIKDGLLKQKKLVFINPKEKSRCGCGESFHV